MIRTAALILGLFLSFSLPLSASAPPAETSAWWSAEVERALGRAGTNRGELVKALQATPTEERTGMAFLIANMPNRDLRSLRADFLRENVRLAYAVRKQVKWGRGLPEDVFLNDVLAYANFDEVRDPWRKQMQELCLPLVKDCKTATEAAQKLNSTIFAKLKVRFSTARKKPNQSPKETIEQGLASCSGLSILLSDACRSVAIPARVVGTPLWANQRGNHTWVEIWDGRWHFTGAAEQDPKGLDRGWFVHDASQATKDSVEHAIYASSFRRTKVIFPLVWDLKCRDVFAENVTDRYATKKPASPRVRVQIAVRQAGRKQRVALPVSVEEDRQRCEVCQGTSRGETADTNDFLTVELLPDRAYVVRIGNPVQVETRFRTVAGKELKIEVEVPAKPGLTKLQQERVEKAARAFFEAGGDKQGKWRFDDKLERLLAENEDGVRRAVWNAYRAADIHAERKKDFTANQVRNGKRLSPYTVKKVGKKPEKGWPLFIAMHGGGNAPQELNDSQWKIMQMYYRDQPTVPGYLYVALRAPNNTWNGFYADYVPPLIINLIRQFTLFGEVDPEKVGIMGYSHGGYGAFYIGPRIPDRFAAVHVSAAAPSDNHMLVKNLRNTRFTFMIGENDTAYGRIARCKEFNTVVEKIQKENPDAFPVKMELMKGFGHGRLPDRDKIKEMAAYRRDAIPRHLTWELLDTVIDRFFWLGVKKPGGNQGIEAKISDNTVTLTTRNVSQILLGLDARLVRFDRTLQVMLNGSKQVVAIRPSLLTLCRSMSERGDPDLACTCAVTLDVAVEKPAAVRPAYRVLGNDRGKVVLLNAAGKVEWEYASKFDGHDLSLLPNGNVLLATGPARIAEVARDGKIVWQYESKPKQGYKGRVEVHAFQRLDNGQTMIAESGNRRIIEVDKSGKIVHELVLTVEKPDPHRDTRMARKLENGNYLVCHEGDGKVREYDRTGKVVWSYTLDLGGRPRSPGHGPEGHGTEVYGAIRLANGNTMIAGGNNNRVLEVTPKGKIVWSIGHDELPGIRLAWVTTLHMLPNGNLIVGNCHAGPANPQLFEVTRDKKVVWTFKDFKTFGNGLAAAQVLDVKGKVRR